MTKVRARLPGGQTPGQTSGTSIRNAMNPPRLTGDEGKVWQWLNRKSVSNNQQYQGHILATCSLWEATHPGCVVGYKSPSAAGNQGTSNVGHCLETNTGTRHPQPRFTLPSPHDRPRHDQGPSKATRRANPTANIQQQHPQRNEPPTFDRRRGQGMAMANPKIRP